MYLVVSDTGHSSASWRLRTAPHFHTKISILSIGRQEFSWHSETDNTIMSKIILRYHFKCYYSQSQKLCKKFYKQVLQT